MEIKLSGGYVCDVRSLRLFELDNVARPDLSPFTYKMKTVAGQEYDVILDPSRYSTPPEKPKNKNHEIKEGTPGWHELREWQIYIAALTHEEILKDRVSQYVIDVFDYIVENCVPDPIRVRQEVVGPDDAEAIMWQAILEPITVEMIQKTLRDTYNATYDHKDIIDCLGAIEGGDGVYNALRVWENVLMIQMNMSELEYVLMPAVERCRKICAMQIDKWLEYLEANEALKKGKLS